MRKGWKDILKPTYRFFVRGIVYIGGELQRVEG